jgi:hypothetical protein
VLVGAAGSLGGKPKVHSSGLSTLTWICSPELWLPNSFASRKWLLHNRARENHHCDYLTFRVYLFGSWGSGLLFLCTYLEVGEVGCCCCCQAKGMRVVVVAAKQRGRRDIRCLCSWEWIMKPIKNIVHICPHVHILWLSCLYRLTLLSHEWTNDTQKIRFIQVTWTEFQEWHKQTDWQLAQDNYQQSRL